MSNPFAVTNNIKGTLKNFATELLGGGYLKARDIRPKQAEVDFGFSTTLALTRHTPMCQCWYSELSDGYVAMDMHCEFTITGGITGADYLHIAPPISIDPQLVNGMYPTFSARPIAATMLNGCIIGNAGAITGPASFVYDASLGVFKELIKYAGWVAVTYQVYASGVVRRV